MDRKISDFNEWNIKIRNADELIIKQMASMLDACEDANNDESFKMVDWALFESYCLDYFTVPLCVIKRCIDEARLKSSYFLAFR